ncbi:DUF6924 domain-containing protein [Nocardia sp. X0981]
MVHFLALLPIPRRIRQAAARTSIHAAEFRLAPSAMAEVEANFLLANVNFEEYADNVDDDGVYRGFDR